MTEVVMPCRLGCFRVDEDGREIPLPGSHGGYCQRDYDLIETGFDMIPGLAAYLRTLVPSALRARPASLGNRPTAPASASLPLDVNALDDLRRLEQIATRWMQYGGLGVRIWVDHWLATAEPDQVARLKADAHWIRRANLRWPTSEQPYTSRTVFCPLDGTRVLVVPPREAGGDREYVCPQCGNVLTERQADQAARLALAVADEARRAKRAAAARERRAADREIAA